MVTGALLPRSDGNTFILFWKKVLFGDGCWEWTANRDNRCGYGRVAVKRKNSYAHRVAYEYFNGPIPEGLQIDHLCRNPGCVNPAHLEAVSHKMNVQRGAEARRAGAATQKPGLRDGQWQPLDAPEPILTLNSRGGSPRLHLNADAQTILREWHGNDGALRVTVVRGTANPELIAVGLDPYGRQLDADGYASAAKFTRKLGVELPCTVTLTPDATIHLLIGHLPETPMPLQLPPPATEPATTLRGIIRQVSTIALPAEEVVHEDTSYHDDEDSDSYDDDDAGAED